MKRYSDTNLYLESKRNKVELLSNKNNLIKREKGDYKYDRQDV